MYSASHPRGGMSSFYVRIMVSFIFALLGYLMSEKANAMLRIIAAYACWSWFWGLVHLYPTYIRSVQSERFSLLQAYGYFQWGAVYICQAMLFGVFGGGIYHFIIELLAFHGKDNTLKKEKMLGGCTTTVITDPVSSTPCQAPGQVPSSPTVECYFGERELKELTDLYHKWSTEDLKKATTIDNDDYRPEAIDLMLKIIKKREQSN